MVRIEAMPRHVVFALVRRPLDPAKPANSHDMRALIDIWSGLLCMRPVSIEQQPRWRDRLEVLDHPM